MCAESESLLSSEVMKRRSVRPIRKRERGRREREERERGEGGEAIQSDAPQHPRTGKKVPPLFQTLAWRADRSLPLLLRVPLRLCARTSFCGYFSTRGAHSSACLRAPHMDFKLCGS